MLNVRRATRADIETLVTFRVALFTEMGEIETDADAAQFAAASRSYITEFLPVGEFVAWLAEHDGEIVASSGMVFFQRPPSPANPSGTEAYVMNMYTLPAWRGKGLAATLINAIIADVRTTDTRRIWLHATDVGRGVYERAGFQTNESVMELDW